MPGTSSEPKDGAFKRLEDADIGKYDALSLPDYDPGAAARSIKARTFATQLTEFLKVEGALAMVKISYRDGMLVHGEGYAFQPGQTFAVPAFELAAEDYRRLVRLAQTGRTPVIELAAEARYDTQRLTSDNIFAEIPGTDPKAGYVMAGAHFDSWLAGDGATDNGAGSVVVMEAARILSRLGVRPRRTIRFALWSGEEQGLLGSTAYIQQHLATRAVDPSLTGYDAYVAWRTAFPITPRPGYGELKAYFNMDNGSGKFRGIYAEATPARCRCSPTGSPRSSRSAPGGWSPPGPGGPIMSSSRQSVCPATSSSRTRSTTAAGSTIRTSTRSIMPAPTTCARLRW